MVTGKIWVEVVEVGKLVSDLLKISNKVYIKHLLVYKKNTLLVSEFDNQLNDKLIYNKF